MERPSGGKEVAGFQEVGLPLGVVTIEDGDPGV
jgi:hypothetical protein